MIKTISSMLLILSLFALMAAVPAKAADKSSWRFQVLLDGKPIGQHSFNVINNNGKVQVKTNASFAVKFLGFTAYTYQHNNTERWNGQCLAQIQASTNDNGEQLIVNGSRNANGFARKTVDGNNILPACLKSFAYWDLTHMKSPQLLNSQTGELMDVSLQAMGSQNIDAGGKSISAKRYRLTGRNLQIDLWYSAQNHWLGLESLKDGRRIRYLMQ